MKIHAFISIGLLILSSCTSEEPEKEVEKASERAYKMGFSTWSYGPTEPERQDTYSFVQTNGDIYSEQVDDRIPWKAWMNNTELPEEFVSDINFRVSKKRDNISLVLSVSPLNSGRNDLIADWDGTSIDYSQINDQKIADAYFEHVQYLVERLQPDYLVAAMEVNDLLTNVPAQWADFQSLMSNVRNRLTQKFPTLKITESITLHNFFEPQVADPEAYVQQVADHINQLDFVAVSFYPFFKGQHTASEFQKAFDFLHAQVQPPIAFVETNHLAEDLVVPAFNTNITSTPSEQKAYLEVLLTNAEKQNYEFAIWWAHRDYDALWETFPDAVKDLGQVWRDTGLLDEDGNERPAYSVWQSAFTD